MAETAPTADYNEPYPKGLDIYDSFDQITTGRIRKKHTPIGVTEEGTKVPLTAEHILHSYGYGPEDLPKKEEKKNKLWEKPITVNEVVDEEPASPELKWNTYAEPRPAKWDSQHNGKKLDVLVTAESDPDSEGNVFYRINHPVAEGSDIPKDELRFIIEPAPEDEAAKTDPENKNKKVEDLPAKERALHPETILRLKEKFDQRLKNQMKDLESLKNTGRLAELYEQAEKTTSDLLRAAVVAEYLDSLSEEDRAEVEPLFNDIVNEMNSSEDALEIKRKMMSGTSEAPAAAESSGEQPEKSTKFKDGQKVKVLHNGTLEDGWEVDSGELDEVDGKKVLTVFKDSEGGQLFREIAEEDLEKWQTGESTDSQESGAPTEADLKWLKKRLGLGVIYKPTPDKTETDWRLETTEVKEKNGQYYIEIVRGGVRDNPYEKVDVLFSDFKKWNGGEQPKTNDAPESPTPSSTETPPVEPAALDPEMAKKQEAKKGFKEWFTGVVSRFRRKKDSANVAAGAVVVKTAEYVNDPNRRKWILAAIGGTAVGAYLLGYLTGWAVHEGHGDTTIIGGNPGDEGGIGSNPPQGAGSGSGSHHEVFNNDHGNRIVESILPNNLEQNPVSGGYEQIVDKNTGKTIVDHATYAGNGRYSVDTIKELKEQGYSVGTNTIELGDTTHKVSVVQKA